MKYLFFIIFFTSTLYAEDLVNTVWAEIKDNYECPDFIAFSVETYTLHNDCYSSGVKNGVVERGGFYTSGNSIYFNRESIESPYSLFSRRYKEKNIDGTLSNNEEGDLIFTIKEKEYVFRKIQKTH
ncbi:MAG: hypothetical protein GY820_02205 [Gammaproteobacteria bacterium]|nr:hypothetical protein [Gammaproteobacteria bacterium]